MLGRKGCLVLSGSQWCSNLDQFIISTKLKTQLSFFVKNLNEVSVRNYKIICKTQLGSSTEACVNLRCTLIK